MGVLSPMMVSYIIVSATADYLQQLQDFCAI